MAFEDGDHAGADVHLGGGDRLAGDIGVILGNGKEADLGDGGAVLGGVLEIFGKAHLHAGGAADGLQRGGETLVAVHGGGQLRAGSAQVLGPHQHDGVGHVENGAADLAQPGDLQHVLHIPGGEEHAGLAAGGVEEVDPQLTGGAVDAGDGAVALVVELAVFDGHVHIDVLVGVEIEHVHRGDRLRQVFHQTHLHRVGGGGGGHVAAVGLVVDLALAHDALAHDVVHVHAGALAGPHDDDLVVGRNAAAHAVDLLGVGRAHALDEDIVPLLAAGQVLLQEHDALGGAAAHIDNREFSHIVSPFSAYEACFYMFKS